MPGQAGTARAFWMRFAGAVAMTADALAPPAPEPRAAADTDDFARIVLPYMAGRRVLDVGCINHIFRNGTRRRESSFYRIESVAREVVGIDNAPRQVKRARAAGHNVLLGDAETFVADEPFDVVHGGDIIEHLSNPGRFLACCRANLRADGVLVLTTPNTFSLANAYEVLRARSNDPKVHPQHTAYFSPTTLRELARRYDFEPVRLETIEIRTRGKTRTERALLHLNGAATRLMPRFKRTLLAVFRPGQG